MWLAANRKFLVAALGAVVAAIAAGIHKPIDDATTQAIVGGLFTVLVWLTPNTPAPAAKPPSNPPPGVTGLLALVLLACAGSSHEMNAATAGAYEGEQLSCVDKAKTLAESHACRCAHPAANGHVPDFCTDGGAP